MSGQFRYSTAGATMSSNINRQNRNTDRKESSTPSPFLTSPKSPLPRLHVHPRRLALDNCCISSKQSSKKEPKTKIATDFFLPAISEGFRLGFLVLFLLWLFFFFLMYFCTTGTLFIEAGVKTHLPLCSAQCRPHR